MSNWSRWKTYRSRQGCDRAPVGSHGRRGFGVAAPSSRGCRSRSSRAQWSSWRAAPHAVSSCRRWLIGWFAAEAENKGFVRNRQRCILTVWDPVHRTAQSVLHFTPWQTCSFQCPIDFSGKHSATLQLLCEYYSLTHPPLFIVRYSFIQFSEPRQRGVNEIAQDSKQYDKIGTKYSLYNISLYWTEC